LPFLLALACGNSAPPPNVPASPGAAPAVSSANPASAASSAPPPASAVAGSKKVTKKNDPSWASCHATYKMQTKDLAVEVGSLAKGCAAATKMKPMGDVLKGSQGETSPHQEFKLKAQAGKCYRVYAESDSGITDLDMLLKDSAGDIAAEDSTDDGSPVLIEDGAVCFKENDDATIIVSVGQGKGNYALQIWSD
jgi:hypothetical protein